MLVHSASTQISSLLLLLLLQTSAKRLNRGNRTTSLGIATLMNIDVRDYSWREDANDFEFTTGFIAQALKEVYPKAARIGGPDPKLNPWQIAPTKLIPLIVKSTQDQQKEIEKLRSENEELRQRLERL
ncbi:MAG: hypothetical protein ACI9P5_003998 [Saprospiraceae bacterium]|jgi:hypothetical protein